MQNPELSRDAIAAEYFDLLPFPPYPIQEEALLTWFTAEQGVLVCAPTGTGKTLIAEAALYEALRTGKRAYYTTPLIALTDQKLVELRESAVRWGFKESDVGLVTGNRKVNPEAPVLVVVAEILLNRLLQPEGADFDNVTAVVMDEFHSFNDPERGVVWELTLGMLPAHVRTLLLSATVGNSYEFTRWLSRSCKRNLELVEGTERKVPLSFHWVEDHLLDEWMEKMAAGSEEGRRTPALIFCFNRDECWQVAELLKGKRVVEKSQQAALHKELEQYDWSEGAGPKLKALLGRGVGVHHAGILPKYRRIVEDLFQKKMLSVTVCTETLSAGINLPARSIVLPTILKGPKDRRKPIDAASAQQIFGRAGRPQYDNEGHVYAMAHEDDVKLLRWREKFNQIPEDTKDPGLLKAKKALKKKMPKRRQGETYWTQEQFDKLRASASADLVSKGNLPWRLLAYMLLKSPQVAPLRELVGRRLLTAGPMEKAQERLNQMLVTLWTGGYITLDPKPRPKGKATSPTAASPGKSPELKHEAPSGGLLEAAGLGKLVEAAQEETPTKATPTSEQAQTDAELAASRGYDLKDYTPEFAHPTERLELLIHLRSINPLYGVFLAGHLAIADDTERLLALESALALPGTVARHVRVPKLEELPAGPLATTRLDHRLLELGLASQEELIGRQKDDEDEEPKRRGDGVFEELPVWVISIGEKLRRLFNFEYPNVHDVQTTAVHVAGEVLEFGGHFNKYIVAKGLQKQEGILFRHLLRLILLLDEMANIPPAESTEADWEERIDALIDRLTECCREVDPESTSEALEQGRGGDELTAKLKPARK
ncbi:DEAD/DEAH box helicase [Aureliella helgolandensis]|uniref:Ski2-like helicase n=1 Tax=Aureliella helgolandensis TaxID=2527968 RepID=A0A518GGB3_9BACT|nr:DEAD/DEAH box helicase [Aureliella helgolandensis]QDV27642.1 ski2-like helicase [Aureliella helgolandensis]